MPKLDLRTALRIKMPAGEVRQLKGQGFAWPDAAPVGDSPAAWFTPSAPFQVTANSAPFQYYQATLAWSHRFDTGELNYPRVSNRLVLSEGGFLDIQGDNDSGGAGGLNVLGSVVSWGYVSAGFTFPSGGFITPNVTHNYVLVWDQAGGLSSGHYAQLWQDGVLVGYVTTQIPDYALYNLRLLGEGANVLPGETQGYWWSNDTAMSPATMFAELFDGANGMLDLASPVIDGVTPDAYQFGP
jgi:hypothetical protein